MKTVTHFITTLKNSDGNPCFNTFFSPVLMLITEKGGKHFIADSKIEFTQEMSVDLLQMGILIYKFDKPKKLENTQHLFMKLNGEVIIARLKLGENDKSKAIIAKDDFKKVKLSETLAEVFFG